MQKPGLKKVKQSLLMLICLFLINCSHVQVLPTDESTADTLNLKPKQFADGTDAEIQRADNYFSEALKRFKQRQYQHALALFQQALLIDKELRNKNSVYDLLYIAKCHVALQQLKSGIDFNQRALYLAEKTQGKNTPFVASILNNLAELYRSLGNNAQARPLYVRSLAIRQEIHGSVHADVAVSLNNLAWSYQSSGDYSQAKRLYLRALDVNENIYGSEHVSVAYSLNNLAALYDKLGDPDQAKPLYLRALAIHEKVYGIDHTSVAVSLNNLAALYQSLDDYAQAKPLYFRVLAIHENNLGSEHTLVADSLNNLATLYFNLGDYARAMPMFHRSLAIREKFYGLEHANVAQSLNNLAELYRYLGEFTEAKPLYLRALAIDKKVSGSEHPDVADKLNNLAKLYQSLGDYAQSQLFYLRALAIKEKVYGSEHVSVATSLNDLALLYQSVGDYANAKPLFHRALAIWEKVYGSEHAQVAIGLNNLAALYQSIKDYAQAKQLLMRAYKISFSSHRPELLWSVQNSLSNLYAFLKSPDTAIFYGKQAVNTIQRFRSKNIKLKDDLQKSFLDEKAHVYRNLANLLIDQDRLEEAEQVLIMLKEEDQFDFLGRDTNQNNFHTQVPYSISENQLNEKFKVYNQAIYEISTELIKLREKEVSGLSHEQNSRMKLMQTQLKQKRKALGDFVTDIETVVKGFSTQDFAFQQQVTEQFNQSQNSLKQLGKKIVLIRYLVTNDKLRILVNTADRRFYRDSSIKLELLNTMINDYRKILQNPGSQPLPIAQRLYGKLIEPIAKELEKDQIETLMVSLDASLRYLPLSALHDGKQYLVERYNLSVYTSAAKTSLTTPPVSNWQVAGFGVSEKSKGFAALPAVIGELNAIVKESDKLDHTGVLPGIVRLNNDFTSDSFEKSVKSGFPVIHIASHFSFQPGNQFNSFLLLGQGKKLSLAELKNEKYFFTDVDLFTLSACDTAVTGKNANGREIESIGTLIQNKGAKAVLATLWPIADKSTGIFMQNFYQIKDKNKRVSKAKALRLAQLDFITGKTISMSGLTKRGGIDPDEPQVNQEVRGSIAQYSHPYYWAPFILMGNWL